MQLFGTDGIRGVANVGNLRPDIIMKVAVAVSGLLSQKDSHHSKVVIGKDTRLSGYMIENALTAGFIASGIDVLLLGPIPTPGVAMLTKSMRADLGIMISASHNPFQDNGIKIFGPNGYKISDEVQSSISDIIAKDTWTEHLTETYDLGKAKRIDDALGRYIEFIKATLPKKMSLRGMKIVIDTANGAAYTIGPLVLSELGADVIAIANDPNGYNINDHCGSTYPKNLIDNVIRNNADIGIALDGDADRVILVDKNGNIIDGDKILALIAINWQKRGMLSSNKVVSTVMANMALDKYLDGYGIELVRSDVGDRHVMHEMMLNKINLGGEQSGHIILSDYAFTGDGLLSALQVLSLITDENITSDDLYNIYNPYPQELINLKISNEFNYSDLKNKGDLIAKKLGARVLIRKSGTEPIIRVMIEAEDCQIIQQVKQQLNLL